MLCAAFLPKAGAVSWQEKQSKANRCQSLSARAGLGMARSLKCRSNDLKNWCLVRSQAAKPPSEDSRLKSVVRSQETTCCCRRSLTGVRVTHRNARLFCQELEFIRMSRQDVEPPNLVRTMQRPSFSACEKMAWTFAAH